MIHYTNEQLATVIAVPIVTILLVWTTAIFHKNRRRWGPYDIPIVAIVVLSIVRNLTILSYTLILTLNQGTFDIDYCGIIVWIFNSIHTFQASSLTTLAVIGLFSAKLQRKNQNVRQFLTPTHVIYHLFCLTTLCACVGVAAILARNDNEIKFEKTLVFETNPCKFMPYELDIKFNIFVIALHAFLASISVVSFAIICYNHFQFKRNGFDYLKKSNSDLSDLSLGVQNGEVKNYYDTYTIQRPVHLEGNYYDQNGGQSQNYQNGFCQNGWNSDISNLSTTVSSTNSRRPCLTKIQEEAESRTGLETIHPVLIVCYLFYHIPLIVLCTYPKLISPWPVAGLAVWLGLIQDLLIPIGLGLIDSRFCEWVSNVYRCSRGHGTDKLPHVGLDGKFRPFGGSQPPSLDITQTHPDRSNNIRNLQAVEHRFPITNGSLYTSIDGRLPVIHNYRRHNKEQRALKIEQLNNASQQPQEYANNAYQQAVQEYCRNCEVDLCPSHSNLHHLSPRYINRQLNMFQSGNNLILDRNHLQKRISSSQESLRQHHNQNLICRHELNTSILKTSRNLIRLNKMRLSKSEDSLTEVQRNLRELKQQAPVAYTSSKPSVNDNVLCYSSSDDEYITEIGQNNQNFDSLSSKSCYSITTEANGDFEFYQNSDINLGDNADKNRMNKCLFEEDPVIKFKPSNITKIEIKSPQNLSRNSSFLDLNHNLKIKRSNSKRSLENFQVFIGCDDFSNGQNGHKIQRSNSYMTLEDRKKSRNKKLLRSNSKLSDCTQNIKQKIKSVEYLPNSNSSTVYIEDVYYLNLQKKKNINSNYIGSVPDLKKVFITEYI